MTKDFHIVYFENKMTWNRKLSNILDNDFQPVVKKTKRKRVKVQCNYDKCKRKSVNPYTKKKHKCENLSRIYNINTGQEVYENADTDESTRSSVLSGQIKIEDQNIIYDNSYDEVDFDFLDFLPRKRISRYAKLSVNFAINDFEQSKSK